MQTDLFFTGWETVLNDQGQVQYDANFVESALANTLQHEIENDLSLKQEAIQLFGKSVLQPRLTAWVADPGVEYEYSGLNSPIQPWTPALQILKARLEKTLVQKFNGVLCNYYRNGHDYMGWHSDDELVLDPQTPIASISLGAERRFDLRKKQTQELKTIHLQHGSLLLMSKDLQQYWQHRLPKQRHCADARINLTFRNISS